MDDKDSLFKLRWDAQRTALLGSIASLFHEEAFIDTTIFTDGKLFKAHRLLLSASSPYLKHVLQSVPGEHAVLLLPHIQAKDFQHVLQFIYEGEIKISQKDLKSFLQVSKLLKIKGMDFDDEEAEEFFESKGTGGDNVSSSAQEQRGLNNNNNGTGSKRNSPSPQFRDNSSDRYQETKVSSMAANNNNNEIRKMSDLHSQNDIRASKYARLDEELDDHTPDFDDSEIIDEDDLDEGERDPLDADDGAYHPLLPEVSMEESEDYKPLPSDVSISSRWGIPHSSTMRGYGNGNLSKKGSPGDGILLRMMKEPLKSSMKHENASGNGAGHGGLPYELDEAGLKRTKRYVQCGSCSKVLSSLSALKRHMEDVHCARIQGKCLICGRVYSSRNSLLTHVYSAHKKHHDYKAVARIIRESDFETFATN